jgi:curved DNA-binding protein CbpA
MGDYDPDELDRIAHWARVLDDSSYYEVLGVLEIADDEAIRRAFRDSARAFHPDLHRDADPELVATLTRLFERSAEAYRVLSDPELRVRYDMLLRKGQLRLAPSAVAQRPASPSESRALDELCRSAGAKLSAQRAAKLLAEGDLLGAKRELERALDSDGGANLALQERLADLDVALYAMGVDQ